MLAKPRTCYGCPLETKGEGWVPADGPDWADILLVGEAAGADEAKSGKPFQGAAGQKLNSLLRKVGLPRESLRVHNLLSCRPPENELRGKSWEAPAIKHCRQHLGPTLAEDHRVIVSVGALATKNLLHQYGKFSINNWHGTVNEADGRLVVPTFHPSFLLQGAQKLTGVVLFDLLRAKQVAEGSYQHRPASLRVDPDLDWFREWINTFLAALAQGQELWLAVDVETIEKMQGGAEDELKGGEVQIVRINFSYNPDEGITVPWAGGYIQEAKRLLESAPMSIYHNWRYDVPLLRACDIKIGSFHDTMNMFKVLQSDLPRGLGFIAPFFSAYPAWKHLSGSEPGRYAAIDAFQTLRCAYGIKRDLLKSGQWDSYMRHVYQLDTIVLHPAEEIGLYIDRKELLDFRAQLVIKEAALQSKIQEQVGEDGRPLCSGAINKKSGFRGRGKGWKKAPKKLLPGEVLVEVIREEEVYVCMDCGAQDVTEKHRCPKPKVVKAPRAPRAAGAAKAPRKARVKKSAGLSPAPDSPLPPGDAPGDAIVQGGADEG